MQQFNFSWRCAHASLPNHLFSTADFPELDRPCEWPPLTFHPWSFAKRNAERIVAIALCKCCCMFFPLGNKICSSRERTGSYSIVKSNLRNSTRKAHCLKFDVNWARTLGKQSHPQLFKHKAWQSLDCLYQYCPLVCQKYRSCFLRWYHICSRIKRQTKSP